MREGEVRVQARGRKRKRGSGCTPKTNWMNQLKSLTLQLPQAARGIMLSAMRGNDSCCRVSGLWRTRGAVSAEMHEGLLAVEKCRNV